MRKNILTLCLVLVSFLLAACSTKEKSAAPAPVAVAPAPEVCTMAKAKAQVQYQGFDVAIEGDTLVFTKVLSGADGQRLGLESHTFKVEDDQGQCKLTECVASREVSGEKLENLFCEKRSRFYKNGVLVWEDTLLKDGQWLRSYAGLDKVPVDAPNWASSDGMDIYMTWVLRSADKAVRVPVWGVRAIWIREGDDYTLMGGEVVLKNPERAPTPEEVVTFLRTNAQGEVNTRGVLYPVSGDTFKAYLGYLKEDEKGWERDHAGDSEAMLAHFDGPVKLSRGQTWPLERVFQHRGTRASRLPNVDPGFLPGFPLVPKLGE